MHHVRELPSALRDVALDGVNERIHAGRGAEFRRHRGDHVGIDDGNDQDVVRVGADEFAMALGVGDDVVDGDFGRRAARRGDGDDRQRLVLRRRCAFEAADVSELGVRHDDRDGLARVDGRAAADRDKDVRACRLAGRDTFLHVLDGRVRLDLVIDFVGDAFFVQKLRHLRRDLELDEFLVRDDEHFLRTAPAHFRDDFLNRARAEIRCLVEDDAVCHDEIPPVLGFIFCLVFCVCFFFIQFIL